MHAGSGSSTSVPGAPGGAPAGWTAGVVGRPWTAASVTCRALPGAAAFGMFGQFRNTSSQIGRSGVKVTVSCPVALRRSGATSNARSTDGRCGQGGVAPAGWAVQAQSTTSTATSADEGRERPQDPGRWRGPRGNDITGHAPWIRAPGRSRREDERVVLSLDAAPQALTPPGRWVLFVHRLAASARPGTR